MEDLAQLISGNLGDMSQLSSSVKPDKCAILQETIDQLERLKQEGRQKTTIVCHHFVFCAPFLGGMLFLL